MSRTLSASLLQHFGEEVTSIAICYHITRKDAVEFGYTDHDLDLTVGGTLYQSLAGNDSSQLKANVGLGVDTAEVMLLFDDAGITEADILAGRFENAVLWVFAVNYEAIASQGAVTLAYGYIGELRLNGEVAVHEFRSLTQMLQKNIGRRYTPVCDAQLGDSRCGIDMDASPAAYKVSDTVASVTSRAVFDTNSTGATDYINGRIVWTGGANLGLDMEVKSWDPASTTINLILPMPFEISAADAFTCYHGCNKTFEDCTSRFSNGDRFRGFPHIPGLDKLHEHSGW